MIDADFIHTIEELVEARHHELEVDGVKLSTRKYYDTRLGEPEPDVLYLHTLEGITDYLEGLDADVEDVAVHIAGHDEVRVVSHLVGTFRQRITYARAVHKTDAFSFGSWYGHEEFVIRLGSMFVDTGDRAKVIKLAGTVTAEQGVKTEDDGITQTVHVRQGVTFVGKEALPNPVELAPFRTFHELEQPLGLYLLRARMGNAGVEWALFEADGGAWRHACINAMAGWLEAHVSGIPIIR